MVIVAAAVAAVVVVAVAAVVVAVVAVVVAAVTVVVVVVEDFAVVEAVAEVEFAVVVNLYDCAVCLLKRIQDLFSKLASVSRGIKTQLENIHRSTKANAIYYRPIT
eukprot:gene11629-21872_t